MINPETKERELAYVVKVDEIRPIEGRDRVECAVVGGWTCMVPKSQFHAGDLGIYFEIDSKVDTSKPYFAFLEKRHGKIKTQKFKAGDGHFYSQGLLMAPSDFGWEVHTDMGCEPEGVAYMGEGNGELAIFSPEKNAWAFEGDFLTKELGVVYADADDNKRKSKSADKYKIMCQRHPKVFRNPFVKWLYTKTWGKKLLFVFFGKGAKKKEWPAWVVKTDEERIQNLAHMIPEFAQENWVATEKVDGTSTTFTMKNKGRKLIVCSRNVVMNQPGKEKTCYYADTDGNVYVEMAKKYDMNKVLNDMLNNDKDIDFVTIQAETYGGSIQKRNYSTKEHDMAVFNVIIGFKDGTVNRLNPYKGERYMAYYGIPYVPIIGEVKLPDTCAGILDMAAGASAIDGLPREGLVFRSLDGARSFKAVDNEFIVKYHG